jgi:hypothetical protein
MNIRIKNHVEIYFNKLKKRIRNKHNKIKGKLF